MTRSETPQLNERQKAQLHEAEELMEHCLDFFDHQELPVMKNGKLSREAMSNIPDISDFIENAMHALETLMTTASFNAYHYETKQAITDYYCGYLLDMAHSYLDNAPLTDMTAMELNTADTTLPSTQRITALMSALFEPNAAYDTLERTQNLRMRGDLAMQVMEAEADGVYLEVPAALRPVCRTLLNEIADDALTTLQPYPAHHIAQGMLDLLLEAAASSDLPDAFYREHTRGSDFRQDMQDELQSRLSGEREAQAEVSPELKSYAQSAAAQLSKQDYLLPPDESGYRARLQEAPGFAPLIQAVADSLCFIAQEHDLDVEEDARLLSFLTGCCGWYLQQLCSGRIMQNGKPLTPEDVVEIAQETFTGHPETDDISRGDGMLEAIAMLRACVVGDLDYTEDRGRPDIDLSDNGAAATRMKGLSDTFRRIAGDFIVAAWPMMHMPEADVQERIALLEKAARHFSLQEDNSLDAMERYSGQARVETLFDLAFALLDPFYTQDVARDIADPTGEWLHDMLDKNAGILPDTVAAKHQHCGRIAGEISHTPRIVH
jgi:hypothetical protein